MIKDDGNGGNMTKETINYKPNGNTTDTNKLQFDQTNTENQQTIANDNINTDKVKTLQIIIENDETLTLTGIGGDTTIGFLKKQVPKLANCIFYDEDGYEVPNPKTKIEAVAEVDRDKFILNAKLKTNTNDNEYVDDDNAQTQPLKVTDIRCFEQYENVIDTIQEQTNESEHAVVKEVYSSQEELMQTEEKQFVKKETDTKTKVKFGSGMKEEEAPSNKGGCCTIL